MMEIDDSISQRTTFTVDDFVTTGHLQGRKSSSRCVSFFTRLLCVLLLAANVGQFFYYHSFIHPEFVEQIQAEAAQRKQLETTLKDIKEEKDQLLHNYNTLKQEKDQLKNENDQLQRHREALQRDKDQLQTNYRSVVKARDELQKHINDMDMQCQSGWKKFECHCFYISTEKRSWDNSSDYCISQGARLAILDNKDKQAFIRGLVKSGDEPWFGLSDRIQEGRWNWVDGNFISTATYWAPERPDGLEGEGEDCAEFWPVKEFGEWNDEPCTTKNTFICEKVL